MSRHIVEQNEKVYVFGWDQPLNSFFLQVHDTVRDEDNQITLWLGATADTKLGKVKDLVDAAQKVGLLIDSPTRGQLYGEKLHGEQNNGR